MRWEAGLCQARDRFKEKNFQQKYISIYIIHVAFSSSVNSISIASYSYINIFVHVYILDCPIAI